MFISPLWLTLKKRKRKLGKIMAIVFFGWYCRKKRSRPQAWQLLS